MTPVLKFSSTADIMQRLLKSNQLRHTPDALRMTNSNGPTLQTGSLNFQGGVCNTNATASYVNQVMGAGVTGGWEGPLNNPLGFTDRGNLGDDFDAGVPKQNTHDIIDAEENILAKGLYEALYAVELTPMNIALTAAEEIVDDLLKLEERHEPTPAPSLHR